MTDRKPKDDSQRRAQQYYFDKYKRLGHTNVFVSEIVYGWLLAQPSLMKQIAELRPNGGLLISQDLEEKMTRFATGESEEVLLSLRILYPQGEWIMADELWWWVEDGMAGGLQVRRPLVEMSKAQFYQAYRDRRYGYMTRVGSEKLYKQGKYVMVEADRAYEETKKLTAYSLSTHT